MGQIIWLVDYDGKIENLALMKLSTYHKQRGDRVILKRGNAFPELWDKPDQVYISCIFRWNRGYALGLKVVWGDKATIGGTGVDAKITLLGEVASCPPDYSLYGEDRAIGFISRGCIRKCPWCIVPDKEGRLHRVSTAQKIVEERGEVLFLDNNFLALPGHRADLGWLVESKVKVDFNQGLDARLITEENAELLARCNWTSSLRIALDSIGQKDSVERAKKLLRGAKLPKGRKFPLGKILVYVLIGFSGVESDIERLLFVHELGMRPFPMGYRDLETGHEPAKGWDWKSYKKYKRLITRLPHAKSVWKDFIDEIGARHSRLHPELVERTI